MPQPKSHYEVLGLSVGASPAEIKTAFRRAARSTHPDHGGDPAEFRLVTLAYETLSDPRSRAAYDRSYGTRSAFSSPDHPFGTAGSSAAAESGSFRMSTGQRATAADPTVYEPAFEPGVTAIAGLTPAMAAQQIHGAPRKRGFFGAQARLVREAGTIALLSAQVLNALPSVRLVNGLHAPQENNYIDHALLAGYRLALVDSMLLPKGVYRWDGMSLLRDGRRVEPPRLAPAVRRMQDVFPEINVTGWTVIHSPDGNLHEPVIDYGRGGEPSPLAPVHVVNAARLVRELKTFLGSGPAPNVVNVPVLARLLGGMY